MSGAADTSWNIIEWSQQEVLNPGDTILNDPSTYDPILGTDATYFWQTPDGETALGAYDTSSGWVYDLSGAGTTSDQTEHDVFISTAQSLSVNMGGDEIDFAMTTRILSETVDPAANPGVSVFAGTDIGFTFDVNAPNDPGYDPSLPEFSVFLQIPVSSTQNDSSILSYFSEATNAAGQPTSVISDQLRTENALLPATGSAATAQSYDVTAYVADLASYLAVEEGLGSSVTNLGLWTMTGAYAGIMTQGIGSAANVQVSNLELTEAAAPSTAALQINAPALPVITMAPTATATASTPAASTASAVPEAAVAAPIVPQISSTNTGALQIAASASATPETSLTAAGAFAVPGGGNGYFDPTGNGEEVARIYQAVFGSHPTAAALEQYTAPVDAGTIGLTGVAQQFLNAPQYQSQYGTPSSSAFVNDVYQNVLYRAPDATDQANATGSLQSGGSAAALLVSIATSPEAVMDNQSWDGSASWGEDDRAFETVVGRAPDTSAQTWMAGLVSSGLSGVGVVSALLNTTEMLMRLSSESLTAAVNQLYDTGLGRAADPTGMANALTSLQTGGGSYATLAYTISNSSEARNLYATATHANWVQTA